jgi:hypothetical protein
LDSAQSNVTQKGPIEVGGKRQVYVIGLVLSLVAVLVGLWVFVHMGFFPPLVLALALFTTGAATFAWLLATGPYVFRIDAAGIHDRSSALGAGRVAWDELESIRVVTADGRPQLGLVLAPAARERRALVVRASMDALRQRHGIDFVIPPEAVGPSSADELAAMLERYRSDPSARASLAE